MTIWLKAMVRSGKLPNKGEPFTITASQSEDESYHSASVSQTINVTLITAINNTGNPVTSKALVYPNPTGGQFQLGKPLFYKEVGIYNLRGRLVKQFNGYSDYYDIGDLPSNMYTIILRSNSEVSIGKIFKSD